MVMVCYSNVNGDGTVVKYVSDAWLSGWLNMHQLVPQLLTQLFVSSYQFVSQLFLSLSVSFTFLFGLIVRERVLPRNVYNYEFSCFNERLFTLITVICPFSTVNLLMGP